MRFSRTLCVVFALVTLRSLPAQADIDGFILEGMTSEGVSLSDRIGRSRDAEEHVINIEDCEAYSGYSVQISWGLDPAPFPDERYTVKLGEPGGSCPTSDHDDDGGSGGSCARIMAKRLEPSASGNTITIPFDELTGGDCEAGTNRITSVFIVYELSDNTFQNQVIDFIVDLTRPHAPSEVRTAAGETSVRVSWTDNLNAEGGMRYRVYYREESPLSIKEEATGYSTSSADATSTTVSGLETNMVYYFRVAAVSPNDNEGPLSEGTEAASTVPVTDFWELYKDFGGEESGGFCFIASAAYGSPLAPHVGLLSEFRDGVLLTGTIGRRLVNGYYRLSPPLAQAVERHPLLAAAVRLVLLPVVLLVYFLMRLSLLSKLLVLLAMGAGITLFRRWLSWMFATAAPALRPLPSALEVRHRRGLRTLLTALLCALAAGAVSLPRPAQASFVMSDDFGQPSPRNFLLEIKFGPYTPNIDSAFEGPDKPYQTIFGGESMVLSTIQFEYQFLQKYGMASAGVGIGFSWIKGKGLLSGGAPSNDSTSLYLLPLNMSVSYHLDIGARRWSIPLVPYGRVGIDYVIWWTTDGLNHISAWAPSPGAPRQIGYGGVWGYHIAGGLKLLLDVFAPNMARTFDIEIGVNHTYLFAELLHRVVDDFGSSNSMRLGDTTVLFGIAFEI